MGYLDNNGLAHLWAALKTVLNGKQEKLTGTPGQLVGFDEGGNAVPQSADGLGGGGSSEETYTTQETKIGTWIDGKPLYRKVVTLYATVASGKTANQKVMDMDGVGQIVSERGSLSVLQSGTLKNYFAMPVTSPETAVLLGNTCCFCTVLSGQLLLVCSTASSALAGSWRIDLVLEYTRTS